MKKLTYGLFLAGLSLFTQASVDSDFKPDAMQRFTLYTGDGNYKQAYRWVFNPQGSGPPVTVFINHGSGGEWYDEIDREFGPCGPDHVSDNGDFSGTPYQGLCEVDSNGERLYLADFNDHHVPVGSKLEHFMLKKIVGSSKFAAWYWQDAFRQFDSPVNVFMVGRYNISTEPQHFDNVLYWLNLTDEDSVSRDTLPPYNFDGYGLSDIDGDNRPLHAAPDISGFDNMFLYKAVRQQFPDVTLDNLVIEGRSNGGSAMIALAADHHIWPQHIRDFWARNLDPVIVEPEPQPEPEPNLTLAAVAADPQLAEAFEQMLAQLTASDVRAKLDMGLELELFAAGEQILPGASQSPDEHPLPNDSGTFEPSLFRNQLTSLLGGNFYQDTKLVHVLYPGCRLDGYMEQDSNLAPGVVDADGRNAIGYQVVLPSLFSFADEDKLYTSKCDDRIAQASQVSTDTPLVGKSRLIDGQVFSPAKHGFDYKAVYKNLDSFSSSEQAQAAQARSAIERAVNQLYLEMGLSGHYQLPADLD
ncbi:hypothetical protein [Lacimicrobium alkaliphilum]|uniref:Uncharacterized protein n=1 Tax=Lacimicrobium alkaliphilum TaxID=1526571 RepID=A0A0U2PE59_9ALTE|nr:hypothetical protein [Lacimicrobium alkaliphilum]ALS97421.1 hypothetical protein AT746_03450 [Lacimicrobium alkaliphilum]